MRLLLDTHVVLWWLADDPALTSVHRATIRDARTTVFYSAVSVVEISIKASQDKLEAPTDLVEQLEAQRFEELPLTAAHAVRLRDLPWHHRDPFDRMLIAQAQEEELTFATVDRRCRDYEVRLL